MMLTNEEIEMSLVAVAFSAPTFWHEVAYVKPDDFSNKYAGNIWETIGSFITQGRSVNPHSIGQELFKNEEDRAVFRKTLGSYLSIANNLNGPDYARIVKDLSDRRKLVEASKEITELANDTSCGFTASEIASRGINKISDGQTDCMDFVPAHCVGDDVINSLSKELPCFPTGFNRFDKSLGGGFYQNRFYGIGARMKSGKSLFMGTIAYQMAMHRKTRILYLCLEMGSNETYQRMLSIHMGINSLQFLKKEVVKEEWFRKRVFESNQAMKGVPLYFRSKPRMTLDDLKATIAKAGMSGKVDGVIVDYMQLVEGKRKDQSSAEHYDNVAQSLAEAVKRFPIWILSAAQLNKDGNIRGSEGLLMACDLAMSLNKKEGDEFYDGTRNPDRAWLETMVSRYTPYMNVGSEEVPAYEIDINNGPSFVELK